MQVALIHANVELTSNQAWQRDTNFLNSCPLFLIAETKQSQKFAKLEKEYKFTSIYLARQHLMILH
jgi:hypothetical protein